MDGLRLCTHLEAFFKVKYTEKTNSFCLAKEFVLNASCYLRYNPTYTRLFQRIHHRNVPTPEHRMYERTSERAHPPPQQQPYVTLCVLRRCYSGRRSATTTPRGFAAHSERFRYITLLSVAISFSRLQSLGSCAHGHTSSPKAPRLS